MCTDDVSGRVRAWTRVNECACVANLAQESSLYWSEISQGTFDFHRSFTDAATLRTLTKADLLAFWEETFAAGSPQRRKLASCVYAAHHPLPPPSSVASAVSNVPIVCVDGTEAVFEFKRTMAAYPAPLRVGW